jgi:hypothetical protein
MGIKIFKSTAPYILWISSSKLLHMSTQEVQNIVYKCKLYIIYICKHIKNSQLFHSSIKT